MEEKSDAGNMHFPKTPLDYKQLVLRLLDRINNILASNPGTTQSEQRVHAQTLIDAVSALEQQLKPFLPKEYNAKANIIKKNFKSFDYRTGNISFETDPTVLKGNALEWFGLLFGYCGHAVNLFEVTESGEEDGEENNA